MPDIDKLNYAQRQRLQFIESVVYWEGMIGRPRVASVFGVSDNHITRDFALYRKAFPDNLDYDVSARTYRLGKHFKPRIGSGSPEEYLALLRTYVETRSAAVLPSIGEGVDAMCLPVPHAPVDSHVLREITRALRQCYGVKIRYQSLTSPEATSRTIWPHALVFAGVRWHVRAYDSKRQKFVDFVLHRVLAAAPVMDRCPEQLEADTEWREVVTIDIAPAAKLNVEQQAVIAKEYGMAQIQRQWIWRVQIRRCLAAYFLRWVRLDLAESKSFPIRLVDPDLARLYRFEDE